MADEIARLGVSIEADNKVDAGAKAAEKRLSEVLKTSEKQAKRFSEVSRKTSRQAANDDIKTTQRRAKTLSDYVRTSKSAFSQVERAAAKTFGVRSVSTGLGGMLSKAGNGMAAFRTAMEEAGTTAGALEVGLGAAATGIGAMAGAAIAGTIAAQKFGAAWAENTAKVGRFAKVYGVGSDTLQAFNAAAERNGAAKGSGMQGIAGLEDSLNAAVYGDKDKMEVLMRLGIKPKRKKDGSVDLNEDTLAKIADKISTRNSYGQRQIASRLGIPMDVLSTFAQGGKALRAQMADAARFSNVQSGSALSDAERIDTKNTTLGQSADRISAHAGQKAAVLTEGVLDKEIAASQAFSSAIEGNFKSSIGILKDAGDTFSKAVDIFMLASSPLTWAAEHGMKAIADSTTKPGGFIKEVAHAGKSLFERIVNNGEHSRQDQVSPKGAVGVAQVMPSTARQIAASAGIPWDEKRFRTDAAYNRKLGEIYAQQLYARYHGNEVLTAAAYNAGQGRVDKWIGKFGDPSKGEISDSEFAQQIPFKETRNYVGRVANMEPQKLSVTVLLPNAPAGSKATVRGPNGAVSHAMAN